MSHVHGLDGYSRQWVEIVDPLHVLNRGPEIRIIKLKHILRNLHAEVSRIIYITLDHCQTYLPRLFSLSLFGLLYLCMEGLILLSIFILIILSLWFGCAITDSCYPVQNVYLTSSKWGNFA